MSAGMASGAIFVPNSRMVPSLRVSAFGLLSKKANSERSVYCRPTGSQTGFLGEDTEMTIKVIGAGIGRTGTDSLKFALEK